MGRTAWRNPSPNGKLRESRRCAAVPRLPAQWQSTHNNHFPALRAHRKHTLRQHMEQSAALPMTNCDRLMRNSFLVLRLLLDSILPHRGYSLTFIDAILPTGLDERVRKPFRYFNIRKESACSPDERGLRRLFSPKEDQSSTLDRFITPTAAGEREESREPEEPAVPYLSTLT